MIRKLFLFGTAAALVAAPLAVQAAPPRVSTPVAAEEELRGGLVLPIVIAIGLAIAIYLVIDDGDDDVPVSP